MLLALPAQARNKKKPAEKNAAAAQAVFNAAEYAQDPLAFLPNNTGRRSLYLNGDSAPELFAEDRRNWAVHLCIVRDGADALVTADVEGPGVHRESVSNAENGEIASGVRIYPPYDSVLAIFEINGQKVTEAACSAYFGALAENGTLRPRG